MSAKLSRYVCKTVKICLIHEKICPVKILVIQDKICPQNCKDIGDTGQDMSSKL